LQCGTLAGDLLEGINLIVVSPGVPLQQQFFAAAREQGIRVIGELALAAALYDKPILAITGTNGKSTVTELLGIIVKTAGFRAFVGGNLGVPLAEHLLKTEETDLAVLEVSSFQLDTAPDFRPEIALLLNISPDHLDRYHDYEEYAASKLSIFKGQLRTGHAVINGDDPEITSRIDGYPVPAQRGFFGVNPPPGTPSASICGALVRVDLAKGGDVETFSLTGSCLAGEPNAHNAAAAILAARIFGCAASAVQKALVGFRPLGHRLSLVGEFGGVKYYDDSKATNIGAVSAALSGFSGPVVLIAGGRDKGGDYRLMLDQVTGRVKAMVLIGEAKDKMAEAFSGVTKVVMAESMDDAVRKAGNLAAEGDSVLLSPACASFDMFDSYSHRGDVFRAAVSEIMMR
ncbi:MAG: UDP-N-acetylmuramoyl-L-alanine--D-glutamate ligase, partial [Proteobacteria bacterium]|nr:UDP-N-acetylmuramoyl-L-alanine--D-glutamate ligase [Pseudomonadota bacterium]MBU1738974.1 UDP-N-acetylmuramoyl-L-alanine--D-glutamate ligase [Pseudomonadota bacterium]